MKQVTIVGAGISGLTAAIILAREGHDVTVLEQENAIGGASLHASDVSEQELCFADMTPLDLDAMSRYLGFPSLLQRVPSLCLFTILCRVCACVRSAVLSNSRFPPMST